MPADRLLDLARRLQAMAQTGLAFSADRYDIARYEELRTIAAELMGAPDLVPAFAAQVGYATPKVDVRALVIREGRVLLVREAEDGLWSLPGGWADVGDTPGEAIAREIVEETGLTADVDRLLGVWDARLHGHAPYPFHAYKLVFLCTETGGALAPSIDTLELGFFDPADPPPLSPTRVSGELLRMAFAIAQAGGPPYFD